MIRQQLRAGSQQATHRTLLSMARLFFVVLAAAIGIGVNTAVATEGDDASPLQPLDTSSPAATYLSFIEQVVVAEELYVQYQQNRSESTQKALADALSDTGRLFDLSDVASANEDEVIVASFGRLADIFNRIPEPDLADFPDADDVEEAWSSSSDLFIQPPDVTATENDIAAEASEQQLRPSVGIERYVIPGTEITIVRLAAGARAGDYVFSASTLNGLKGWRQTVSDLPVRDGVIVKNWVNEITNATGYRIPQWLLDAMPESLETQVFGIPLWKLIADILVLAGVLACTWLWRRFVVAKRASDSWRGHIWKLTTPVVLLALVIGAQKFLNEQVNHSGEIATTVTALVTVATWTAFAWIFWLGSSMLRHGLEDSPRFKDNSDGHFTRLVGKVVTVTGVMVIVWVGLAQLGVSTIGLGVGAGVFALAISLAATGTLENLIGGITLYADKPFSVDDKITVDTDYGTVVEIGPRSTSIRKLDDTVIVLPNSQISSMKTTNFSARRHMEFRHVIGVRYETTADQLRNIVDLANQRLREHPQVLNQVDYPRVLIVNFGESSIDIEVRARLSTHELFDFQVVQQDLLLVVLDVVESAGSGMAFPSTTMYIAQDEGLGEQVGSDASDPGVS